MHARKSVSHPDRPVVVAVATVFVASAASRAARWARISSARSFADVSTELVAPVPNALSNWDVLSMIATGSGV